MKIAVVNFPSSLSATGFGEKEYHYKTYIETLNENNLVVVETATGYTVARFKRYVDQTEVNDIKYIVQLVRLKRHKQLKEQCEIEALLD
ncbi:hypothetical protein MHI04_10825 [Lysinibacillus sp. FSL K6-1151]|uniref:hypothetical protein n=1 Tax=Lysinibacillus sp. FSL K6-1151 TaxID=2921465 RepID=UPI00315ABC0C